MNILCVMPWYPANAPVFLAAAFEKVGCHITRIGPKYFDHMGLTWPESDLPMVDFELPREAPHCDLDGLVDWATRAGYPPDLLYVSEENYKTEITPTSKVPVILWSQDGWPENYQRINLFQPTVAYCNQPRGNRYHPLDDDVPVWKYLPGAAAPWVHRDLGLDRSADFCLYGTMYGKRPQLVAGLNRRGFKVLHGARTTEQYVRGLNSSVVTYVNLGYWEVKWRFFESIACGCLVVAEDAPPLRQLGFLPLGHFCPVAAPPDETGDPWPTPEKIAEILTELRLKRTFVLSLTSRARDLVLQQHTYLHRVTRIAQDVEIKPLEEMAERAIDRMLTENKLKRQSALILTEE